MPTPRKSETRLEFLARRREYDRKYEKQKRTRTPEGKRVYTREQKDRSNTKRREKRARDREQFGSLANWRSWRKSIAGKDPNAGVAKWFRNGFAKTGTATDADIIARRSFLAWMMAYKTKFPQTDPEAIARRVEAQSRTTLEQGAGFDWRLWQADYDRLKGNG